MRDLGYEFTFSGKIFGTAALNFVLFAVIAFPLGLALGFIAWNPRPTSALSFLVSFLEIFLFVALLEELFFRGFLQTLISNTVRVEARRATAGSVPIRLVSHSARAISQLALCDSGERCGLVLWIGICEERKPRWLRL